MTGIDQINQRILEDAREKVQARLDEAAHKAETIMAEARLETEEKKKAIVESGSKKADELYKRLLALSEIEFKKKKLSVRQELVKEAFDKTLEMLCNMPSQEYCDFLAAMITGNVKEEEYEIILSPKDREAVGERLTAQVQGMFKAQGKHSRVRLSPLTAEMCGGLILKSHEMEINYSFEAIMRAEREKLESLVYSGLELT